MIALKSFAISLAKGAALGLSTGCCAMALAQSQPDLAAGELRKIDLVAGKVTIRHGEIRSIDMPPMTMVFVMKTPQALAGFKVGDQVKFAVIEEAGKYVVTELRRAP